MHAICAILALCTSLDHPTQIPAESAAVCRINSGCTGVCVHPHGLILSADHCGSSLNATATFEAIGTLPLTVAYDPPTDGIDQVSAFTLREPRDMPYVAIATRTPRVGDEVFSIGYPAEGRNGPKWTMNRGKITHTQYTATNAQDAIRCDFPVWGGNSGGPLFNADGELIGICSASDRNSFAVWIGPQSIKDALAQCPGGYCPNGKIQLGPPIEIQLPPKEPLAPEPQTPVGPIDDAYRIYKWFAPDAPQPQPPAPAPQVETTDNRLYELVMVAATTAGTIFGLRWLPALAQLLLALFGAQIVRKTKPDAPATQ